MKSCTVGVEISAALEEKTALLLAMLCKAYSVACATKLYGLGEKVIVEILEPEAELQVQAYVAWARNNVPGYAALVQYKT